jgi:threonyl-tRNA synthetase
VIIPIADRHMDYCIELQSRLKKDGLRVELDRSEERMNAKIRNAQLQKIPFMLVVGDRNRKRTRWPCG